MVVRVALRVVLLRAEVAAIVLAVGVVVLPGNAMDLSAGGYRPAPWWGKATPGAIAGTTSPVPSAGPGLVAWLLRKQLPAAPVQRPARSARAVSAARVGSAGC